MTNFTYQTSLSFGKIIFLILINLAVNSSISEGAAAESYAFDASKAIYTIHCEVFNKEEHPVIGANVRIAETVLGSVVDKKGQAFIKNVPKGTYKLLISAVGYETFVRIIDVNDFKSDDFHIHINAELQQADIMKDRVVVTGTRSEKIYSDVPVKVSVIDGASFEETQSVSLCTGLSFQPGLRVENMCQNCGTSAIRLNGLEGRYTQVLIDGKATFSALNGVYGLEQIPPNMIDRVEVVRGGGSALYGGNAVGGVINIITKDPDVNSFNAAFTQAYTGGTNPDGTIRLSSSVINEDQTLGMSLFGMHRNRMNWDANDDGFSEVPKLTLNSFGGRMFYKLSHLDKINLEYHTVSDDRRGGSDFGVPVHRARIAEATAHITNSGGINYDHYFDGSINRLNAYISFQQTDRNSYYGSKENESDSTTLDAYGTTANETYVAGIQYIQDMGDLFGTHLMTFGYEIRYDWIKDVTPQIDRVIDQYTRGHGVYIQDDWTLTDAFNVLLGVRFEDQNYIEDVVISPRANFLYKITDKLSFRGSFSTGFRGPQAFDEDLHITQVGGESMYQVNAKGLKPEYSKGFGGSADYSFELFDIPMALSAEYFYTHLDDVFTNVIISNPEDSVVVQERRNGSGAAVQGSTIELQVQPDETFDMKAGFTYQMSKYDSPEKWNDGEVAPGTSDVTDDMLRSPDWYGFLSINIRPTERFAINISSVLTGPMLVPHLAGYIELDELIKSEAFLEINTKFSYKISLDPGIELIAGVQNVLNSFQDDFDKGLYRDAGYIYGPFRPRTLFVGIKAGI
jgi:outer membrane receptor for ferrienterochelin and colicins